MLTIDKTTFIMTLPMFANCQTRILDTRFAPRSAPFTTVWFWTLSQSRKEFLTLWYCYIISKWFYMIQVMEYLTCNLFWVDGRCYRHRPGIASVKQDFESRDEYSSGKLCRITRFFWSWIWIPDVVYSIYSVQVANLAPCDFWSKLEMKMGLQNRNYDS